VHSLLRRLITVYSWLWD